ncbi:MAG: hypothetical protein AAF571_03985 [Verrucomicrobiota bacterium]
MKTLTHETRERAMVRHESARREQAETLVAMLTHFYIHLGMEEARAYRSALVDFEPDYPAEVAQLRTALS